MKELTSAKILFLRRLDHAIDKWCIAEANWATKGIFDQGGAEAYREVVRFGGDVVPEFEVASVRRARMQRCAGLDRPCLTCTVDRLAVFVSYLVGIFGAPLPDWVKVL